MVFIHCVDVRKDSQHDSVADARNSFFGGLKAVVSNRADSRFFDPYWGEHAAKFSWNCASLPTSAEEVLGKLQREGPELVAGTAMPPGPTDSVLLTIARRDGLNAAVDLLWGVAGQHAGARSADELAEFAERAMELGDRDQNRVGSRMSVTTRNSSESFDSKSQHPLPQPKDSE